MSDLQATTVQIAPESLTARRLKSIYQFVIIFSVMQIAFLAIVFFLPEARHRILVRAAANVLALAAAGLLAWWGISSLRHSCVRTVVPPYAATVASGLAVVLNVMLLIPLSLNALATGETVVFSPLMLYMSVYAIWSSRPARLLGDSQPK